MSDKPFLASIESKLMAFKADPSPPTTCTEAKMSNPRKLLTCSNILTITSKEACGGGNAYFTGKGWDAEKVFAKTSQNGHDECSAVTGMTVGWHVNLADSTRPILDTNGNQMTDRSDLSDVFAEDGCCSVGGGDWSKGKYNDYDAEPKAICRGQDKYKKDSCCTGDSWTGSAPIYKGDDYTTIQTEAAVNWHQYNHVSKKMEIFHCTDYNTETNGGKIGFCEDGAVHKNLEKFHARVNEGIKWQFEFAEGDGYGAPEGETAENLCCECGGGQSS